MIISMRSTAEREQLLRIQAHLYVNVHSMPYAIMRALYPCVAEMSHAMIAPLSMIALSFRKHPCCMWVC